MNDVINLNKSIKNIEKKRRELLIRNQVSLEDYSTSLKKKEKSFISLKKDSNNNIMIKHLMSDKYCRSKMLEDVFNKNYRDKKEILLKSNNCIPYNLKKRFHSFLKKPVEKTYLPTYSGYINLKDKIKSEYHSNYTKSLSRNNYINSVSISTANISKNNISLNKSQGGKKLDTSNLQTNPPTKLRDYTSTIMEYKTLMNKIKKVNKSVGK